MVGCMLTPENTSAHDEDILRYHVRILVSSYTGCRSVNCSAVQCSEGQRVETCLNRTNRMNRIRALKSPPLPFSSFTSSLPQLVNWEVYVDKKLIRTMSARGKASKAKVDKAVKEKPEKVKVEKVKAEKPEKAKPEKAKTEKAVKSPVSRTRKSTVKEIPAKEIKDVKPEVKPTPLKPEITPEIPLPKPATKPATPLPPRANPLLAQVRHGRPGSHGLSPRILTFMGVGLLSISTYCGYLYTSYRREAAKAAELNVPADVSDRYNSTASTFDADVATSETLMRLGRKRSDLIQQARGNVLEVSCGTGRNLGYYDLSNGPRSCRSVSFVDLSPQMVEVTRQKAREVLDSKVLQRVAFRQCDAGAVSTSVMPAAGRDAAGWMRPRYFDTVVQTMGLCSMPDPVRTLQHLGSITEPQKGQILLLEHGRSYYEWLNRVLDNLAPAHANRHGCWWNRDIGQIVRDSGLEVMEVKRWHLGTTWRVVLRPGS